MVLTNSTRSREALLTLLCAAAGIVIALIPWLINQRIYYHDDIQHWYMPLFYHIGTVLREGEVPFISLANFLTSNLLGEYQTGLFSPPLLLVFAILPSFSDYTVAGLFFVGVHMAILGSGLYALARSYKLPVDLALIFVVALLCNNMISYWFAGTWWSLLYSTAWLVWAWAALNRADTSRLWLIGAAVLCYLTITSGFPNATLLLGFISVLVAFTKWRESGRLGPAVLVLGAMGAASLFAAIPLFALLSIGAVAGRVRDTFNNGFLVPDLRDVLSFSSPFHRGLMSIYGGYRAILNPIFFAAWFAWPLLVFINWRRVDWRPPAFMALLGLTALLLLATQGPEQLVMLRYPFRWIPYVHLGLVLSLLILFGQAGLVPWNRRRGLLVTGLMALQFVLSFQATPQDWLPHLVGALACLGGIVLLVRFADDPARRLGVAAGLTLAIFVATHAATFANWQVAEWGVSAVAGPSRGADVPDAYGVYIGDFGNTGDPQRLAEYGTGLIPLGDGRAMINGYTPLGHAEFSGLMCMDIFGLVCPEAGQRLLGIDPETGVPLADLFRINVMTILKGPHLDLTEPALDPAWSLESEGTYTKRYRRALPNAALPGTLSWVSPGLEVTSAATPRFGDEELTVKGTAEPTRLIFARLYWPGYHAFIGDTEIALDAYRGVFVEVHVPAGAEGRLSLRFIPPHRTLGLAGMGAGLLLLVALVAWFGPIRSLRHRRRGAAPA